jgi:hypothetical protein
MKKISYSGYRFPPEIIQQAVWLYFRFGLSFRDSPTLGEPFRADDRGRLAQAPPQALHDLAS